MPVLESLWRVVLCVREVQLNVDVCRLLLLRGWDDDQGGGSRSLSGVSFSYGSQLGID